MQHSRTVDLRSYSADELMRVKCQSPNGNPFQGMKIKESTILDKVDKRSLCKACGKSRKYFCYTCYIPVAELQNEIPKVKLPCSVDIIKHPREIDGKSTAIHAAVIASDDVKLYIYPDIPNYTNEKDVYLIFPDKNAIAVEDFCFNRSSWTKKGLSNTLNKGCIPTVRIVFIDSTWNQTKRIHKDERLKDLPCLQFNTKETLFWRYQKGKPSTYLATIEAIYYFIKDFHLKCLSDIYDGEYDNLLFFFKFMYEKIHALYGSNNLLAYKSP